MTNRQKKTEIGLELEYIAERSGPDNLYRQVFGYWPETEYAWGDTEIIEMIITCSKHAVLLAEFFGLGVTRRESFCGSEYIGIMSGLITLRKYHRFELAMLYEYSVDRAEQVFMYLLRAYVELKRIPPARRRTAKQVTPQLNAATQIATGEAPAGELSKSVAKEATSRLVVGVDSQCVDQISLSNPVEELELSNRTTGCLLRAGIETVAELLAKTPEDLKTIRYFGDVALAEVQQELKRRGLALNTAENTTRE